MSLSLSGAFASVALALLFPVIIDTILKFPNKDFGKFYWKLIKVSRLSVIVYLRGCIRFCLFLFAKKMCVD